MKKYHAYIIICLLFLLLLIDGFFPFYSVGDFGPIVNDKETYISTRYNGWQSTFFILNLSIIAICAVFALIKIDKIASRIILITLSSVLLFVLFLHYLANSVGHNGGPFIPRFEIGYKAMLLIDILLLIYCFVKVENQEED
jgi:hypothetical protein